MRGEQVKDTPTAIERKFQAGFASLPLAVFFIDRIKEIIF